MNHSLTEVIAPRRVTDCPNCGNTLGSRYHEVACDPRGNIEDGPVT